jgi:hypothetical protein
MKLFLVAELKNNNPEFQKMLKDIKVCQFKVNELRHPLVTGGQMIAVDGYIQKLDREEEAAKKEMKEEPDAASPTVNGTTGN